MADHFLDSSALVKVYVEETRSDWVDSLTTAPIHSIWAVRVTGTEVVAGLFQRVRMNTLRQAAALRATRRFRSEFGVNIRVIEVGRALVERAMDLAEHYPLRGYDAVQLAGALTLRSLRTSRTASPFIFVSADIRLNTAARSEGFTVENPNDH